MKGFLFFFLGLFMTWCTSALGDVPSTMSYQGRLTDGSGNPVADGNYDVVFRIYSVPAGGSALWNSGIVVVTVAEGLFSHELGGSTPLPSEIFSDNTNLWLGITVESDPEIDPRTKLSSHSWAFHSASTDSFVVGPGIAQQVIDVSDAVTLLNGFSATFITEDTIFAPDSGYVMVSASGTMTCSKAAAIRAGSNLEFRDSTLVHLDDQESFWVLPTVTPAGIYAITMHIHRVFKVQAGRNIITFLGADFIDPGNTFIFGPYVMTMTYFPYNYGAVELLPSPARVGDQPRTIPISQAEMDALRKRAGVQ